MLMRHEGTGPRRGDRFLVYDDATGHAIGSGSLVSGHPTIGYGRALDLLGLTAEEGELLLTNDVLRTLKELQLVCPWFIGLDTVRQDAIVDATLNLGLTKLLGFHDFLAAMRAKSYRVAATALLDSNAARTLRSRYEELAAMLRTGAYISGEITNA